MNPQPTHPASSTKLVQRNARPLCLVSAESDFAPVLFQEQEEGGARGAGGDGVAIWTAVPHLSTVLKVRL